MGSGKAKADCVMQHSTKSTEQSILHFVLFRFPKTDCSQGGNLLIAAAGNRNGIMTFERSGIKRIWRLFLSKSRHQPLHPSQHEGSSLFMQFLWSAAFALVSIPCDGVFPLLPILSRFQHPFFGHADKQFVRAAWRQAENLGGVLFREGCNGKRSHQLFLTGR